MKIKDEVDIKGVFELFIYKNGQLIEHYVDENMILKRAKVLMSRLIAGDSAGIKIEKISFGTNATPATPDDTAITAPFTTNISSKTYPADGQVSFAFSVGTAEANGKDIAEFGLMLSDGTYYARKVRGVIEKESDMSFTGTWTLIF